jgi:hypothetical protein
MEKVIELVLYVSFIGLMLYYLITEIIGIINYL